MILYCEYQAVRGADIIHCRFIRGQCKVNVKIFLSRISSILFIVIERRYDRVVLLSQQAN